MSKTDEQNADAEDAEPKKTSTRILQHELNEAQSALNRSASRLFVSGLSAGLDLGFSVLLIAILKSESEGLTPVIAELLLAGMYAFGFIVVVLGRSELFTEQTTLAVLPLLSGETSLISVIRLWSIVYVANLIGATAFAALLAFAGPAMGRMDPEVLVEISRTVVDHDAWVIFVSAVLAGWLMGLLTWLVAAGRDTISQIVIVLLITGGIGLTHLHHSILGTTEVLAGMFSGGDVTPSEFCRFLFFATLGNAVGGGFFVAVLKFGQARRHRGDQHSG